MGRPRRQLTETERTTACDRCRAQPGERCTTETGRFYSRGVHAERKAGPARRRELSADGIHPRTLAETARGAAVVVRDAFGNHLRRIATTGVVPGQDFLVVWVAREGEWAAARRTCREPQAVPWPAGDVWLPGDEPDRRAPDARPETAVCRHCEKPIERCRPVGGAPTHGYPMCKGWRHSGMESQPVIGHCCDGRMINPAAEPKEKTDD